MKRLKSFLARCLRAFSHYWHSSWWHKTIVVLVCLLAVVLGGMYGVAAWYMSTLRNQPLTIGVSFIPDYANYLGVDPHQTFTSMLGDLGVKHVRLVSYWSDIEQTKGTYDFSELDWEFQQANVYGAKVTLAIGLRQPRWPECHMPDWATSEPIQQWQPQLEKFMTAVIDHYKGNPALDSYQLENEYYLHEFGTCTDDSTQRFIDESKLVRGLDPHHTLIISRSNNIVGWEMGPPTPDEYGMAIYRRVWSTPIGRYLVYPFPSWYYAFMAGMEKIVTGKDTFIHELQTEPWVPDNTTILNTSLAEQNKTFNAQILKDNVQFAEDTGMRTIYLWGAEYWYYRMTVLHDASVWNAAKQVYQSAH